MEKKRCWWAPIVVISCALALLGIGVWAYDYANRRTAAIAYLEASSAVVHFSDAPAWIRPSLSERIPNWLRSVEWIDLFGVEQFDLTRIGSLNELQGIFACDIDDQGLQALRSFRRLKELGIDSTKVTDSGLSVLEECRQLESLYVGGTPITDAGLIHLSGLPLRKLGLADTSITGEGFRHLARAPLSELRLSGTAVSDVALAEIAKHGSLEVLDLDSTHITDAGLAYLAGLRLKQLHLDNTAVTDLGISHLSHMPLNHFSVTNSDLTLDCIPTLRSIRTLEALFLSTPPFNDANVRPLREIGIHVHLETCLDEPDEMQKIGPSSR